VPVDYGHPHFSVLLLDSPNLENRRLRWIEKLFAFRTSPPIQTEFAAGQDVAGESNNAGSMRLFPEFGQEVQTRKR
jgi:hypothetical protein